MTAQEPLDRNIGKLLSRAPEPEAPRPGAGDRIFAQVTARLAADRRAQAARRWLRRAAAAAVVAASVALAITQPWRKQPTTVVPPPPGKEVVVRQIQPAAGAPVAAELSDGSRIEVAGGSRAVVTTWPDRARPLVELERGEVTCEVSRGKGRFTVKTPVGEAIALGTKYKVRLDEQGSPAEGDAKVKTSSIAAALVMTVTVLSGEVLVRDLAGKEQLALAGTPVRVGDKPASEGVVVEKWKSGQLVPRLADGRQGAPLEVRKHEAKVTIREQIALVEVDQTFYNPSDQRLEGTFYFPLPAGSTICRLAMYVGDLLMEGEIAEAQRARRTFEALLVQRQDPALLEWAGGNNFKMRVFPIEAKSEKRVLISYYQVLKRESGKIAFSYPLVSDSLQTHPVGKIGIKVTVDSTPEITGAKTPGYGSAKVEAGRNHVEVSYAAEKAAPERDFNLEYNVAKGQGELVVVPYWHERNGDGYFLMIFSPELEASDSEKLKASRFVLVLDKSGGLGERQLALGVKAVKAALAQMRDADLFGLVAYDTFARKFQAKLVPATAANVKAAGEWLDKLSALGASDLGAAWKAAGELAGKAETQVVYVGSGLSTLTSTKTGRLLADAGRGLAGRDVRVHCLALGGIQDGQFLNELARKYSGTVRPLASAEDVAEHVGELMSDYGWPLYKDVRMEFEGVGVSEVYPVWFPNVTAGRQLFAFGRYFNQGQARVRLTASYKDRPYAKEFAANLAGDRANVFVPKLWATRKIEHLQQESALAEAERADDLVRTVIETSKSYRVMSQYTSFIVLETPEDYLRFGIERRRDMFSDEEVVSDIALGGPGYAGGRGEAQGGEFKKATVEHLSRALKDDARADRMNQASDKLAEMEQRKAPEAAKQQLRERSANAAPAAPMAAMPAEKALAADAKAGDGAFEYREAGARRAASADFDTDVLAWARRDIFPVFGSTELGSLPRNWRPSDRKAMDILKAISARYESLALKITAFSLDKDGKETKTGREWTVALDALSNAFTSYRLGDDQKDVSDGGTRFRLFPTLKYAAKRAATKSDLQELGNALPGFLVPWAERMDRDWLMTVEKQEEGGAVVLRLARRGDEHTYTLLYLDSEKGPITRIEVFERRWKDRSAYAFKARTITGEDLKDLGGVKLPTVFKTVNYGEQQPGKVIRKLTDEAGGKAIAERVEVAPEASSSIVRLSEIKVNYKPEAADFKVELPKDWAVRELSAAPRGEDVKPISHPVNPSPNMGNWGGRRMIE